MKSKNFILGFVTALLLSFVLPLQSASAGNGSCDADDPCGGWVVVDADGTVVSGAQVCTPSVCGDPNSSFSKSVLKPGQHYVQQTYADPNTGNVAGIGNNNPGTVLTYNNTTQVFTVTRESPMGTQVSTFGLKDTKDGTIKLSHPDGIAVLPEDTSTALVDTSTVSLDTSTVDSVPISVETVTAIQKPLDGDSKKTAKNLTIQAPKAVVKLTAKQIAAAKAKAALAAKKTVKKKSSK